MLRVTSISVHGWTLVTTTLPRLAASAMMAAICSPRPTDMVQMTRLHIRPTLESLDDCEGLLDAGGYVCVAPNPTAPLTLEPSTGSMAKMRPAPARRAPWTAAHCRRLRPR